MSAVDPLFAQWLQADAERITRTDAASAQRWGNAGATTERVTGIATRAAAIAEADQQLAFFARGPFAIDVHQVLGTDWAPQLGQVVSLSGDQLGYGGGVDVFVIGVEADRGTGLTTLTVVVPLRSLS